ncbi:MAG: acetylxylan esterase, partial [Muribaculaceae bacterium]
MTKANKIKNAALSAIFAAMAVSATSASAQMTVNVHQNDNWWWTAPAIPNIELGVVNPTAQNSKCQVDLIVDTDMKTHVCTLSQSVNVAACDSTVVNFSFPLNPGFYRCTVKADGNEVRSFNIGFEPENIVSLPDSKPDFRAFWDAALAQLAQVAPEYEMTEEKDKSDKNGKVYLVKMRSIGGEQIQGYLTVPAMCSTRHRYPVIVHYMGYGSKPWYPHTYEGSEFIEFVLSTRGQGLNEPQNKYGDWVVSGLQDKDEYYYRNAFMDLIRALDFISQLPEADTRNIFAEGGSQGGAFTLAACALDDRIRAAAPWIPFLNDYTHYFEIVNWPADPILRKQKELGISDDELYATLSYFDIKNFARMITCPIL